MLSPDEADMASLFARRPDCGDFSQVAGVLGRWARCDYADRPPSGGRTSPAKSTLPRYRIRGKWRSLAARHGTHDCVRVLTATRRFEG